MTTRHPATDRRRRTSDASLGRWLLLAIPVVALAVAIAVAYVLGMVAPLLVLTLAWDRADLTVRLPARSRKVQLRVGGWRHTVGLLDAVGAGMFAVMGLALVGLGATGTVLAPTFQVGVGTWLRIWLEPVLAALDGVPDLAIGAVLLAAAAGAVWLSARPRRTDTDPLDTAPVTDPATAPTTAEASTHDHPPHCH